MKLTVVFIVLALMQVSAASLAQKASIDVKNASIDEVFYQLTRQTGHTFVAEESVAAKLKPINLKMHNVSLNEILIKCFKGEEINIIINEKDKIVIIKNDDNKERENVVLKITGKVIDEQGKPVPNATVKVKNTQTSSVTNQYGMYSIIVPDANAVLVFSSVGFASQEIRVLKNTIINMTLKSQNTGLNEVMVIGYGTAKKSDLTGSIAKVSMEDVNKAPVISVTEALAGRVAGVQVSSNDGQPGAGQEIVIRGSGSLTQSTAPLYVIDGFPTENFDPRSLNNDDIESMNVLKDASATAIYGARGSNGVIIIETKKGKLGKPVVTLNSMYGFQSTRKQMELMNPYEYLIYQQERNSSSIAKYLTNGRSLESYKNVTGINWADEVFNSSPYLLNNFAIRGGTQQTKYSVSGAVNNHQGIISNTGTKRYQGRLSLDQTLSSKITVGVLANYSFNSNSGVLAATNAGSNTTSYLFSNIWGYRTIHNDDNVDLFDLDFDPSVTSIDNARFNPVVTVNNTNRLNIAKDLMVNGYFNYVINPNFTLRLAGTVNSKNSIVKNFYNSKTIQGSPANPLNVRGINGNINYSEINNWSNENVLSYQKTFKKLHKVNAVAGFSMQSNSINSFGVGVQNLPNEELGYSGFDEGVPYSSPANSSIFTLMSYYARATYNYNSRYIFTSTIRADGSSKFEKGKRWGYFPSASFAWNMTQENFFKKLTFISQSKIRLSHGLTGNNRVTDFAYLSTLGMPAVNAYSWNNGTPSKGIIPTVLGNLDLKWEVAHQTDLGYDLGLFQNKLTLTVDVYRKITDDLLLNAQLPTASGFNTAFKNIGKVANEGLEFSLNTVNIKNKTFSWSSDFNISFNRNKVLELNKEQDKLFSFVNFESQYNTAPLYIAQVGKPVAMLYGYIFDGIYQYADFDQPSTGNYVLKASLPTNGNARSDIKPGDIKYKDINNDGVVDSYDQTIIGRLLPIHIGGFNNNFTYKDFDLNVFFQWSYGNKIFNANRLLFEGNATLRPELNQFASYVDRWTPTNSNNNNFRVGGQGPLGRYSDRILEDGSYLRLKTLSLSYNVKPELLKKLNLKSLRITVAAQNLLTWTNYSGMDPEVSARNSILTPGFDFSTYPLARTFVFGINVSL